MKLCAVLGTASTSNCNPNTLYDALWTHVLYHIVGIIPTRRRRSSKYINRWYRLNAIEVTIVTRATRTASYKIGASRGSHECARIGINLHKIHVHIFGFERTHCHHQPADRPRSHKVRAGWACATIRAYGAHTPNAHRCCSCWIIAVRWALSRGVHISHLD